MCRARGIVFSTEPKWNILERADSATHSSYSPKMLTALYAVDKMISMSVDNTELHNRLKIYYTIRAMGLTITYSISEHKYTKDKKKLRIALKKYKAIFICSNVSAKNKLKYYLLLYIPSKLIRIVYNFKKAIGGLM